MEEGTFCERLGLNAFDSNRSPVTESPRAKGPRRESSGKGLWEVFAHKVAACGVELFDIELPSSRSGTLRVFISRGAAADQGMVLSEVADSAPVVDASAAPSEEPEIEAVLPSEAKASGVRLEDCARVSKTLLQFMESEEGDALGLRGHDWDLEVSSPGVNRALRRVEHFSGAVGERVKVRFARSESVTVEVIPESERDASLVKAASRRGAKRARRKEKHTPEMLSKESDRIAKRGLVTGVLFSVQDAKLVIIEDSGMLRVKVPLQVVREARVDFVFS